MRGLQDRGRLYSTAAGLAMATGAWALPPASFDSGLRSKE